jgi:hypothetical protein
VSIGDSALADVGAVDASDSVALVCAPPLLVATPGATWAVEDVAPDVFVASVAVVPLPVDVDPVLVDIELTPDVAVDEEAVPVVDEAADPVDDSPDDGLLAVEPAELDEDDSEDVPVVSAAATP